MRETVKSEISKVFSIFGQKWTLHAKLVAFQIDRPQWEQSRFDGTSSIGEKVSVLHLFFP